MSLGTPTKLSDAHDQTITAEMIFGLAVKGDRMCMDIVEEVTFCPDCSHSNVHGVGSGLLGVCLCQLESNT